MKISLQLVIGVITLVIAGALGSTIGKEVGTKVYNKLFHEESRPKVISKTGLTQALKEGHIKGCVNSGGNETYCECTFEQIKDKISLAEYKKLADEYKVNQVLSPIFQKAMIACVTK